jgi:hypothetical protein
MTGRQFPHHNGMCVSVFLYMRFLGSNQRFTVPYALSSTLHFHMLSLANKALSEFINWPEVMEHEDKSLTETCSTMPAITG